MSDGDAVSALENLLQAMDAMSNVTASLIERVQESERRLLELQENVATLGVMMQNHATQHLTQHSIRVVPPVSPTDLVELANTLRAEFAAEAEQLTARIDHVHTRALKALTDLTEKRTPA